MYIYIYTHIHIYTHTLIVNCAGSCPLEEGLDTPNVSDEVFVCACVDLEARTRERYIESNNLVEGGDIFIH